MSREVRRVPLDWDHPRRPDGHYQPMRDKPLSVAVAEWQEEVATYPNLVAALEAGEASPDPEYYRPEWPASAVLGFQIYEDVSEGTPLSPVFATAEELVEWLTHPQAVGIGGEVIAMTSEAARRFVADGWAPSMVYTDRTGFVSGLEFDPA